MPVAQIDPYFGAQLNRLQEYAREQALGLLGEQTTTWLEDVDDPHALKELGDLFKRSDIDTLYERALMETAGVLGDTAVLTLQGDYQAVQERAWRLRHAGRIRRRAWSAARLHGQGQEKGIFDRILQQVGALLEQSQVGFITPSVPDDYLARAQRENEEMGRKALIPPVVIP